MKDDAAVVCSLLKEQQGIFACFRTIFWDQIPFRLRTHERVLELGLGIDGCEWVDVPVWLHDQPPILLAALKHKKISFDQVPDVLQRNHREIAFIGVAGNRIQADDCSCFDEEFWREAIAEGRLEWQQLPTCFRKSIAFALGLKRTKFRIDIEIMESFALLRGDISFWSRLLDSWCQGGKAGQCSISDTLHRFAPKQILADRDFMVEVCSQCSEALEWVDPDLLSDISFLKLVLPHSPGALQYLDHQTQLQHYDLVKETLPALGKLEGYSVRDSVARALEESFWSDFEFALAWISQSAGLGVPHILPHDMRTAWLNNRDIHLQVVKLHGGVYPMESKALLGDPDFMLEAVQCHPRLYNVARSSKSSHVCVGNCSPSTHSASASLAVSFQRRRLRAQEHC